MNQNLNLTSAQQDILAQANAIDAQTKSANDVLAYIGNNVVTKTPNLELADESPAQKGLDFINRCEKAIHDAICVDFKYCSRKDEVDSDLKKYLPEIIQDLVKEKAGATGPTWLVGLLAIFGIASWEAAIASIAIYAIKIGLDHWCNCQA